MCIVTGDAITPENDSKAHIIPSALGGAIKPLGILSRRGNGMLGDLVDLPLIASFQPIMTLLDGVRDRGDNQPIILEDGQGRKLSFEFGSPLRLAKPEFQKISSANGDEYQISARTMKEMRTLLGRVQKEHPAFDIDAGMAKASRVQGWPEGNLKAELQIGPRTTFPALYTSASILAAHLNIPIHPDFNSYIDRFDPENPEMPPDTFYFSPNEKLFAVPAKIYNIVALYADPQRKSAIAYIEILSLISVSIIIPYTGLDVIRFSHAVDALSGKAVEAIARWDRFDKLSWEATHTHDQDEFRSLVSEKMNRILAISQDRQTENASAAIVDKAWGPVDGRRLEAEDMTKIVDELRDRLLLEWKRPGTKYGDRNKGIEALKKSCGDLEGKVPERIRSEFKQHVSTTIAGLVVQARSWGSI